MGGGMSNYVTIWTALCLTAVIVLFVVHLSMHKPRWAQSPWVDSVQCPTDALLIENGKIIFSWCPDTRVIEIVEPGVVCEQKWQ
jgi:hypothetical protein